MPFSIPQVKTPIDLDKVHGLEEKLREILIEDEFSDSSSSSYDDSDASSHDSSDWDSDLEELQAGVESLLGSAKGRPIPTVAHSSPAISQMIFGKNPIPRSESTVISNRATKSAEPSSSSAEVSPDKNPVEHLRKELKGIGISLDRIVTTDDSYLTLDEQCLEGYHQVAIAARQGDLAALKAIHMGGTSLQSSNNYGESVQHIVCRRGHVKLLKYLVKEAKTSLRVRDDVGRTPLHDAVWTDKPNFEVVKIVLTECPDFLFVKDRRGHLPLHYIHRDQWEPWCSFLTDKFSFVQAALKSKYVTFD